MLLGCGGRILAEADDGGAALGSGAHAPPELDASGGGGSGGSGSGGAPGPRLAGSATSIDSGSPSVSGSGTTTSGASFSGRGADAANATCTPSVATWDGGVVAGSSLTCLESKCSSALQPCATDCTCNAAVLRALQCVVNACPPPVPPSIVNVCAQSGGPQEACFLKELNSGGNEPTLLAVATCLQSNQFACAIQPAGASCCKDGGCICE